MRSKTLMVRSAAEPRVSNREARMHNDPRPLSCLKNESRLRWCRQLAGANSSPVMPGLDPGIHDLLSAAKTWMAGTSPAMTEK